MDLGSLRDVAGPVAQPDTCPSAFWRGLRVEAFDGTVLDVADTPDNAEKFTLYRAKSLRGP